MSPKEETDRLASMRPGDVYRPDGTVQRRRVGFRVDPLFVGVHVSYRAYHLACPLGDLTNVKPRKAITWEEVKP